MKKCYLFLGFMCLVIGACEDFFEKDLTGKKVQLLVPADSTVVRTEEQTFLWEELEGATAYRLRVVSPGFSRPTVCWTDTLVIGHRFLLKLPAGVYAWGVKAENSAWKSEFCFHRFTVDIK